MLNNNADGSRTCVPEAGIKGMEKQSYPSDTGRCNYLSLPLTPTKMQASRAATRNYYPQILRDVITCPCPWMALHWMTLITTVDKCKTMQSLKHHLSYKCFIYSALQRLCILFLLCCVWLWFVTDLFFFSKSAILLYWHWFLYTNAATPMSIGKCMK